MAAQHYFPVFETLMGSKDINLTSDTLNMGLIASGTFTWGTTPEAYEYVSQLLAGDGTHGALTEVSTSSTGYSRQALTSVTLTSSGEVVTLSATSPAWASATFSTVYGFLYDASVGSGDSSHPLIAYWDFGGSQSVSSATFTLTVSASGLVQWTAS
jgi:hypothetical protein